MAAFIVVAALSFVGCRAIRSIANIQADPFASDRVERTEVEMGQGAQEASIEYDGFLYSLRRTDVGASLVRSSSADSEPLELLSLAGDPVSLILYDGAFVIAENTASGWDVMAYQMGDGSLASALVDGDGNPVAGEGSLASAVLDGDELVLTTADGQAVRVSLR